MIPGLRRELVPLEEEDLCLLLFFFDGLVSSVVGLVGVEVEVEEGSLGSVNGGTELSEEVSAKAKRREGGGPLMLGG
jgi:hypothetical protein